MKFRMPAALAAFALALSLASCLQDGPSTETGNPNLRGTLTDPAGAPIAGTIKLYNVSGAVDTGSIPEPLLVAERAVGPGGEWRFDSLHPGKYAAEGIDAAGKRFGLLPGLALASERDTLIRRLAVDAPGVLRGRATRGDYALPAGIKAHEGIFVRVGGVARFAVTDTAGAWRIADVPAGTYTLSFAAADGHFRTARREGIAVAPGADVAVPPVELVWSRFVAPPAVRGVAFQRDSSANSVRISWRPVALSDGGNVAYEVTRSDTMGKSAVVNLGVDTFFVDLLGDLPIGTPVTYVVRAVNPLGQRGPADTLPPVTAPGRKPDPPAQGVLEGVVHAKGTALASARVELYAVPAAPGPPDSLPLPATGVDTVFTGADGRWRFDSLPAGRYAILAAAKSGSAAFRAGLEPRAGGTRLDSLEPLPTGSVEGAATRDRQWVTSSDKGDENIHVSLAGTPFSMLTGFGMAPAGAPFAFRGVPPGSYRVVIQPLPQGYFLADTQSVKVVSGDTARLPAVVKAAYNPNAPPPKLNSLTLASATRQKVALTWTAPTGGYPFLRGYRVLRLSAALAPLDSSAVIPVTGWVDDVSKVAAGTELRYVVRVVAGNGREGEAGGNGVGNPVIVTVPP